MNAADTPAHPEFPAGPTSADESGPAPADETYAYRVPDPTSTYPAPEPTAPYAAPAFPPPPDAAPSPPVQAYQPPASPAPAPTFPAPGQAFPAPGFPPPGQAYPGYPPPGGGQAYPGQAYPGQAYPGQAYPGQAYPGQAYPGQAYPAPGYPPTAYPAPGQPTYPPAAAYPAPGYPPAAAYPAPGYPPTGYPGQFPPAGYYQQAPGFPAPPNPYQSQETNRLAIISLVTGLIGLIPFGLIFGILAIRQINRTGERGRGQAVGGLIAAGVWMYIVYSIIIGVRGANAYEDAINNRYASPTSNSRGMAGLYPGICIDKMFGSNAEALTIVPCTSPHEAEVYSVFTLPEADGFEGATATRDRVRESCEGDFQRYRVGKDATMRVEFLYPATETDWYDDRSVVCVAVDPSGPRTGSLQD
ncbi:hypothetical protein L3i22_079640 [Actinoplanes sp. L3-i22]|nr:hypothetical protein L3i22_079640 [Actinoplanes sp. L3-i22]